MVFLVFPIFSKDFGASGLRCGVLVSENEAVNNAVDALAYWACCSGHTQYLLGETISDDAWVDAYVGTMKGLLRDAHARIAVALDAGGIRHLPADSGFFVLLDLHLPRLSGLDVLARLRARRNRVPVLVVTARDRVDERVRALDAGADDYLIKPFQLAELAARCRALLRRPGNAFSTILEAGNVTLNSQERSVFVNGKIIETAPREVDLLEQLIRRIGRVIAKPVLESALYALDTEVTPNALEASVSRLRKRLGNATATVQIKTIHGVGYALFETTPPRN